MDWSECNENGFIKKSDIDKHQISSLIISSKDRLITNDRIILDEISSSTKISIVYETLRELLEALALKNGYKIHNHECFCSFLKEICNEEKLSEEFNSFRIIRNKVNYYGKKIPLNEAASIIEKIICMYKTINDKYFADT